MACSVSCSQVCRWARRRGRARHCFITAAADSSCDMLQKRLKAARPAALRRASITCFVVAWGRERRQEQYPLISTAHFKAAKTASRISTAFCPHPAAWHAADLFGVAATLQPCPAGHAHWIDSAVFTCMMRARMTATALFLTAKALQLWTAAVSSLLCSCCSLQLALKALIPPRTSSSRVCSSSPDQAARITRSLCTWRAQLTAQQFNSRCNETGGTCSTPMTTCHNNRLKCVTRQSLLL